MTPQQKVALSIFIAAVVLYPLVMRALASLAQPARLRLADNGKFLLASTRLPERSKEFISLILEDAFDWHVMVKIAVTLPLYVGKRLLHGKKPSIANFGDAETDARHSQLISDYIIAIAAANPFFAAIVAFEGAILAFILLPIGMLQTVSGYVHGAAIAVEKHRVMHS